MLYYLLFVPLQLKKCRTGFLTAGRVTNNLNYKTMSSKKKTAEKVTAKVENTAAQVDAVSVDTTAPQVATENAVSVESTESVQTLKNVSFRVGDSLTTTKGETLRVESVESRKETGQSALYHCLINGESVALTSTQIKKRCGYIIDGRTNSPRATKLEDIPTLYSEYEKTVDALRGAFKEAVWRAGCKFVDKLFSLESKYGVTTNAHDINEEKMNDLRDSICGKLCDIDTFTTIQTERIKKAEAESESNRASRKAEKIANNVSDTERAALLSALLGSMTEEEKRALLGA